MFSVSSGFSAWIMPNLSSWVYLENVWRKRDKYIKKILKPLLTNVVSEFKKKNNGKNLSEVSQFKDFKETLDQIFGSDTQNVDQKLKGLFY